jgi:hypothetical protein
MKRVTSDVRTNSSRLLRRIYYSSAVQDHRSTKLSPLPFSTVQNHRLAVATPLQTSSDHRLAVATLHNCSFQLL